MAVDFGGIHVNVMQHCTQVYDPMFSFFVLSVFKTNQSTAKRQTEKTRDASVAGPAEAAEPGGTVKETGKKKRGPSEAPTFSKAFSFGGYLEDFTFSGDP